MKSILYILLKGDCMRMRLIKRNGAELGCNNEVCKTLEYSFGDKDMDLAIATLSGRYPEVGYCVNLISKELVYIIDGSGEIYFEDKKISFEKGDAILINNNEKYYWDTEYCKISMICTPAWSKEQYKIIK